MNNKNTYDFTDFHKSTEADFLPALTPQHEPDFVSGSGSVYWDDGKGVFRSSDHWAGMNGCTGQASCRWSILDAVRPGVWVTGYCSYSDFRARINVSSGPDMSRLTVADRRLALRFAAAGECIDFDGYAPQPLWTKMFLLGSSITDKRADLLFASGVARRRVLIADEATVNEVLRLTAAET